MLKKIRVLFLGLVVLAGSACVTPTHASSATPIILTYIQAAGEMGAKNELIIIYNNGPVDVDITDWCLVNKSSVAFACFVNEFEYPVHYKLPAYTYATLVSEEYAVFSPYPVERYSLSYGVTNQSSGSIVASSDSISLVNSNQEVVDTRSWNTPLATGKAWSRTPLFTMPDIYAAGTDLVQWSAVSWRSAPADGVIVEVSEPDPEDNPSDPPEEEQPIPSEPPTPARPMPVLAITELLANPAGSDTGKEFIELYNPTTTVQSLDEVKVRIGLTSYKWYAFPEGATIPPLSYISFTNEQLGFTLVNTGGGVQLYYEDTAIGEQVEYVSPKDDHAWALIEGAWQYTATATPGAANSRSSGNNTINEVTAAQKPCASNQFRNPETGRCKLIATTKIATPCKPGQERNPETNRCRSAASSVSSPSPCKEGQERNPETNRCRNIVKMSQANYGLKGVQTTANTQLRWYYWVAIGLVIVLLIGYAVWEWRVELLKLWQRLKTRTFAKH